MESACSFINHYSYLFLVVLKIYFLTIYEERKHISIFRDFPIVLRLFALIFRQLIITSNTTGKF